MPSHYSPPYIQVQSKTRLTDCIWGLNVPSDLAKGGEAPLAPLVAPLNTSFKQS